MQTQRADLSSFCLEGALGQLISGNSFLLICVLILVGSPQAEGVTEHPTAAAVRPLGVTGRGSVLLSPCVCFLRNPLGCLSRGRAFLHLYLPSALRCLTYSPLEGLIQQLISLITPAVGSIEARQALGMDASTPATLRRPCCTELPLAYWPGLGATDSLPSLLRSPGPSD